MLQASTSDKLQPNFLLSCITINDSQALINHKLSSVNFHWAKNWSKSISDLRLQKFQSSFCQLSPSNKFQQVTMKTKNDYIRVWAHTKPNVGACILAHTSLIWAWRKKKEKKKKLTRKVLPLTPASTKSTGTAITTINAISNVAATKFTTTTANITTVDTTINTNMAVDMVGEDLAGSENATA